MTHAHRPHLIAIGGLSGSGKSTLARALAAERKAFLLRSDVERKTLVGVAETDRLGADAYTSEVTAVVYQRLCDLSSAALCEQVDVIVDAVFQRPRERCAIEAVAVAANVMFVGLWLDANLAVRRCRVAARTGDASDATPAIVDQQALRDTGPILWHEVSTSGSPDEALRAARAIIGEALR